MEFLVLTPPVCPPSEPAAGAFLLAAGLAGRGRDVALLDLSLELYHRALSGPAARGRRPDRPMEYLLGERGGYEPLRHRGASSLLHQRLKSFEDLHPGWRLTLMDLAPPVRIHHVEDLSHLLEDPARSPFGALWREALDPVIDEHRPREVVISLAYLSQLPAAIDLTRHLLRRGIAPIVGGSLPSSLKLTGSGLGDLEAVFPRIETGDGMALVPGERGRLLDRLAWPRLLSPREYLSARPVIPWTLSMGCSWSRCLFCPDRPAPFERVEPEAFEPFAASIPQEVLDRRPVIHLLDSALPPDSLRRSLPILRRQSFDFFGFARPDRWLDDPDFIEEAASSGCLMLQLGVESASERLLHRFHKGIEPERAERIIALCAAAGIRTYVYLLFGLPGETEEDREATRRLLQRSADRIDFLNLSLFNLPRNCELVDRAEEFGIELGEFSEDRRGLRLYRPFTVGGRPPRADARRYLSKVLEDEPFPRAALRRTPRWFRPAHLALLRIEGRRSA